MKTLILSTVAADSPTLNGARLMPEVLRESGYVTFGTAKWHNGQPFRQRDVKGAKDTLRDHTMTARTT